MSKYHVIDTPCRPKRFKVENIQFPGRNNSWTEYFRTPGEAQTECDRRNKSIALDLTLDELTRLTEVMSDAAAEPFDVPYSSQCVQLYEKLKKALQRAKKAQFK